jgi:predicted nucleotidyltransferase
MLDNDDTEVKFGLKQTILEKIIKVFSTHPQIQQVILYGSRAKGNFRNGSDIDLTIRGESITLSQLLKIENDLDDLLLPYKIDLSLLHQIHEPDLNEHISRVGVVIYDKKDCFSSDLNVISVN